MVETSSIMHPYTFNSSGTTARALNPSSSDIKTVNALYSTSTSNLVNVQTTNLQDKEDGIYLTPSWSVYYEDESELEKAADLVIYGSILNAGINNYSKDKIETYNTISTVDVKEIIKGKIDSPQIQISQMGGFDGSTKVIGEHTTLLNTTDEVILFLKEIEEGLYRPINEDDGI